MAANVQLAVDAKVDAGLHSNRVYLGVWSSFSRRCRYGDIAEGDGILLATGGLSWPGLNLAMLTSPAASAEDLRARLDFAAEYYSQRNRVWLAVLYEPWVRSVSETQLAGWGLQYTEDAVGMVAERLLPRRVPCPSSSSWKRAIRPVVGLSPTSTRTPTRFPTHGFERPSIPDPTGYLRPRSISGAQAAKRSRRR